MSSIHAHATAAQALSAGSYTTVNLTATRFNRGSGLSLSSNAINIGETGFYMVQAAVRFDEVTSTTSRARELFLRVGTTNVQTAYGEQEASALTLVISCVQALTSGNTVSLQAYSAVGVNLGAGAQITYLSVTKLGA